MSGHYAVGDFEVRTAERRVCRHGEPLPLGSRAFELLMALIENRDRVLGKDELMALVWPGLVVEENNLSVQVSALRKLLGADAITTVAGRGYRLTLPVAVDAPNSAFRVATGGREPPNERPSIAVLPFEVRSDDVSIGFLADGLVEDVIAQLARVPGFLVISRSSSFEFRRRRGSLTDIARQLGVRYLVEGSVRPIGTRLRVATHLVEAESGRVLWSGQLEGERAASADLQEGISRGIITELEPELTRAEITLIQRRRPDNQDAWIHYHRAVGAIALTGWREEAVSEAQAEFERALAIDPKFALAAAHFAVITSLGLATGLIKGSDDAAGAALQAAERALALEDGDSQVLGYAGCALADLGQHERGEEVIRQALDIDPSNAQAHVALGATLALQGHWGIGIEKLRHGMRISPRDRRLAFWGWALSQFLLHDGRAEDALHEAQVSAGRDVRLHLPRVSEAAALAHLGRLDEAGAALATARRLRPSLSSAEVAQVHGRHVAKLLAPLWPQEVPPLAGA